MAEYKLSYTASEIDERLGKIDEIENILANGSGKTLIGELDLNSTTITASDTTGEYDFSDELILKVEDILTTLNEGFDVLTIDIATANEVISGTCTYNSFPDNGSLGVIYFALISGNAANNIMAFTFTKYSLITNMTVQIDHILSNGKSINVKFYTISGGGSSSGSGSESESGSESGSGTGSESGISPKRLVGEITLTNNTASASDTDGIYNVVNDIQAVMLRVFSILDQGFDMLVAEILIGDLYLFTPCTYSRGSDVLNVLQSINCDIPIATHLGYSSKFSFLKNSIRANDVSQEYVDLILSGAVSMNVKFYVWSGTDLPNAEEASF